MLGGFDNSTINQVQQANDITDLISEHISLTKKGKEMVGLCPFHEDHRPSLYVNAVKQIFKCFACGAGGDVFKFVQMRENLTFPQAVERLAERAGIKLKKFKTQNSKPKTIEVDPNRLAKVNLWAAKYFCKNLYDQTRGKSARSYIAKRKIKPELAKKWQLGLAYNSHNNLIEAAKTKAIPTKLLEQAGLVINQRDGGLSDKFVNRLMFPITDVTGRVIGFGGRALDETGPKYINSPTTALFDKSNSLYGLEQARHQIVSTGTAVVAEGYTDCIMAHQFGCSNVVAALGTSFTSGQGRILRRYAKKVILVFDSDTAGIEAANRALEICLSQHIDIKLASVPEGKDPCDFLLANGAEQFEKLLDTATDVFEFKWNRLLESFDADETIAGRKSAIEEFLQTIATTLRTGKLTAIDRGLVVNRLSNIIGLSSRDINAELNKTVSRAQRFVSYNIKNQKVQNTNLGAGLFATAQQELLEVLLNEPKLFETVKQKITADLFDIPILRQAAALLFETFRTEPQASLTTVLAGTESVELGNTLVQLAQAGEEKGNYKPRLNGAMDVIQRHQRQRKKSEIKATGNQKQFLRRVCENTDKKNPHNIGMR